MGIEEILLMSILMGGFVWTFYKLLTDDIKELP